MKRIVLFRALLLSFFIGLAFIANSQTTDTYSTAGSFTWTCPPGVTSVTVQCWGGGGGGYDAAGSARAGTGGGGGAFAQYTTLSVTPNTSYTVFVGSGGNPGASGTDSWFSTNTTVLAKGGTGGSSGTTVGVGGAAASCIGDIKWSGGNGASAKSNVSYIRGGGGGGSSAGTAANGTTPANAGNVSTPGVGGVAPAGGGDGGAGGGNSPQTNAESGKVPGGGGGGSDNDLSLAGSGASGQIKIIYTQPACSGIPAPGNTISDVSGFCSSATVNFSLQNQTFGSGVTYQWQSSTDNASWSNVGTSIPTYSATVSSDTYFQCVVTCPGFTAASSISKQIVLASPEVLTINDASRCGTGAVTLSGTASVGTTLNWYDVATGGTSLATGDSYTTPALSTTKDYYVESVAGQPAIHLGPISPTAEGGTISSSNYSIVSYYQIFNVISSINLVSVDIFPTDAIGTAGSISIANNSGTILTTVPYITTVTGGSTPQTVVLNFSLPIGTGYRIGQGTAINLNRNTSNAVYPYTSASVNMTGNNFLSSYYYYFYNLNFSNGCSSSRATVTATITTPPTLSVSSGTTSNCSGSASAAITLTAGGTDYDTYSWSPSSGVSGDATNGWTFSPSSNTTYTLTSSQSTGSFCANIASVAVTTKPLPGAITITPSAPTVCPNVVQSLASNGGTMSATFIDEHFATSTFPAIWQTTIGAGDLLAPNASSLAGGTANEARFTGNSFSSVTDRLYAGPFNTNGYTSLSLSWKNYMDWYSSTYPYGISVETSSDGVTWHPTTWSVNPVTADIPASTQSITINTADVGSSTFYVAFTMSGETFGANWWDIDDILLTGSQNTTMSWTPTASLFTDAGATIPYSGNPSTVFAQTGSTQTYTATATGTNGCTLSKDVTVTVSCALPITIVSLTGAKEGTHNILRWTTATESNNNGFEVQRSTDGIHYSAIGYVQSVATGGNSSSNLSYLFTDNSFTGTVQYYRLRQVDNDNTSHISSVVVIRDVNPIALSITELYPNPASSFINVVISAPTSDKVTAIITDVLGNTILQKQLAVEKGNNVVSFNIAQLASGTYFVKLICNNNCPKAVGKFVKK